MADVAAHGRASRNLANAAYDGWTEVAFGTLTALAVNGGENALNNPLLAEALVTGHVATQVLAIRRLMEDSPKARLSLRSLIKDLNRNAALFTRENYVCYDGSPSSAMVFRVESGLAVNRLRWPIADELRRQADVECSFPNSSDDTEILGLTRADLPILDEVRTAVTGGLGRAF